MLSGFDAITAERAAALAAMSDEELAAPAMTPAGPSTYGRFMRIRVFDCWIHELDLRDGLGLDPPTTARPAAIAVDEASASLPYVLAKRVGVPRGTTVVIEPTGWWSGRSAWKSPSARHSCRSDRRLPMSPSLSTHLRSSG